MAASRVYGADVSNFFQTMTKICRKSAGYGADVRKLTLCHAIKTAIKSPDIDRLRNFWLTCSTKSRMLGTRFLSMKGACKMTIISNMRVFEVAHSFLV